MSIAEAKAIDKYGKGGGLVDGKLVREFPVPRRLGSRSVGLVHRALGRHNAPFFTYK